MLVLQTITFIGYCAHKLRLARGGVGQRVYCRVSVMLPNASECVQLAETPYRNLWNIIPIWLTVGVYV